MHRLKCGLVPYHHDTPLSSMSVAVVDICRMLQQAVDDRKAERVSAVRFVTPEPAPAPFIPSITINPAPTFDGDISPSIRYTGYVPEIITPIQQPFQPQAYQATDTYIPSYNHANSENAGQFHTPLDTVALHVYNDHQR
jgi:hypothetical protein